MVRVMDKDMASSNVLAFGRLDLGHAVSGAPHRFNLELERGGLPAGALSGVMQMAWAKPS